MAPDETVACWECGWRGAEDDCAEPDGSNLICEILSEDQPNAH